MAKTVLPWAGSLYGKYEPKISPSTELQYPVTREQDHNRPWQIHQTAATIFDDDGRSTFRFVKEITL